MSKCYDTSQLPPGLIELIEEEFPDTAREGELDFGISKRSEFHSLRLDDSFHQPLNAFGLGPNKDAWKRVRKAALELKRAIIALRLDGIRELNWAAPWSLKRKKTELAFEAYYMAELTSDAAARMMKKRKAAFKASKKRDWRSAALAQTARTIWAEEAWYGNPDLYGPEPSNELWIAGLPESKKSEEKARFRRFEAHVRDFAPKAEKYDLPGPFGAFLNKVLRCYERETAAASALRSMRQAQEAIRASLQKQM
ncbi:MAG: hypothetical protein KJN60_00605 [Boseongicola sp.]|nr:hypothetical protein [Boseongicola sp.]